MGAANFGIYVSATPTDYNIDLGPYCKGMRLCFNLLDLRHRRPIKQGKLDLSYLYFFEHLTIRPHQ